ncbi:MAG: YqgE/AlgH family protein [Candidatus Binatia bacterium]
MRRWQRTPNVGNEVAKRSVPVWAALTALLLAASLGVPLPGVACAAGLQGPAVLSIGGEQRPLVTSGDRLARRVQGRFRPEAGLAKGKFLIASRRLRDPNFSETVILLIAYGVNGAMGVVINRPTDVKLSTVLPEVKELRRRTDTLYIGGPVARNGAVLLLRSSKRPAESVHVFDHVYASPSLAALRKALGGKVPLQGFHAYAGHAGWAPGQLDAEVARGDWHVSPADPETVFDQAPLKVWQKIIRRVEGKWVREHQPDLVVARERVTRPGESKQQGPP